MINFNTIVLLGLIAMSLASLTPVDPSLAERLEVTQADYTEYSIHLLPGQTVHYTPDFMEGFIMVAPEAVDNAAASTVIFKFIALANAAASHEETITFEIKGDQERSFSLTLVHVGTSVIPPTNVYYEEILIQTGENKEFSLWIMEDQTVEYISESSTPSFDISAPITDGTSMVRFTISPKAGGKVGDETKGKFKINGVWGYDHHVNFIHTEAPPVYEEPIHIEQGKSHTYYAWSSGATTVHFEPKGEGIETKFIVHAQGTESTVGSTLIEASFEIEAIGAVGDTFSGVFKFVGQHPYEQHVLLTIVEPIPEPEPWYEEIMVQQGKSLTWFFYHSSEETVAYSSNEEVASKFSISALTPSVSTDGVTTHSQLTVDALASAAVGTISKAKIVVTSPHGSWDHHIKFMVIEPLPLPEPSWTHYESVTVGESTRHRVVVMNGEQVTFTSNPDFDSKFTITGPTDVPKTDSAALHSEVEFVITATGKDGDVAKGVISIDDPTYPYSYHLEATTIDTAAPTIPTAPVSLSNDEIRVMISEIEALVSVWKTRIGD